MNGKDIRRWALALACLGFVWFAYGAIPMNDKFYAAGFLYAVFLFGGGYKC